MIEKPKNIPIKDLMLSEPVVARSLLYDPVRDLLDSDIENAAQMMLTGTGTLLPRRDFLGNIYVASPGTTVGVMAAQHLIVSALLASEKEMQNTYKKRKAPEYVKSHWDGALLPYPPLLDLVRDFCAAHPGIEQSLAETLRDGIADDTPQRLIFHQMLFGRDYMPAEFRESAAVFVADEVDYFAQGGDIRSYATALAKLRLLDENRFQEALEKAPLDELLEELTLLREEGTAVHAVFFHHAAMLRIISAESVIVDGSGWRIVDAVPADPAETKTGLPPFKKFK